MSNKLRPETYILWGIPAIFLLGGLFHFLYEWSGNAPAAGLIAPVNESIFEHMKMASLPAALWWGTGAAVLKKRIRPDTWWTAALFAVTTTVFAVPLLYYFYTGAFGVHFIAVDILNLLIAVSAGQLLGLHLYRHCRGMNRFVALLLILALLIFFAVLTVRPPELPLFRDPKTGAYGISPEQ